MNKIWAIAQNTFIEGLRSKTLYALLAYLFLILFSVTALVPLTLGEHSRILRDFGLAGIEFLSIMLAIVVGTTLVYKEVEKRTIHVIVSKPVERFYFLLGKYLGMELLLGLMIILMTAIFTAGILILDGKFPLSLLMPIGMTFLKVSVINSIALFFSSLSSPILGAVFTFCLYLAGTLNRDILNLAQRLPAGLIKTTLKIFYYLLPNMGNLDLKNQAVFDQPVLWPQVWWSLSYSGAYIMAVLMITSLIFEKKDFK
ncbi:ABC transporter permease [candidate division TA06 bacterium]|nr:ABC transporter permease [candidate division TA06 bacterium]